MNWVLIIALALLPQGGGARRRAAEAGASQPFERVWRFETNALSGLRPGGDASLVVVPMIEGKFVALAPIDGSLLWTADPGGDASAPPLVTHDSAIVATSRTGTGSLGVLRALDRGTGLSIWVREMPKPVVSEMLYANGRIYFGSSDGSVYALRADSGAVVWAFATRGAVRGQIQLSDDAVLVGSDDGALYALDWEHGTELWRVQTGGAVVGRPALTDKRMFVTSGDGVTTAYDRATRKVLWRARTGAAIEAGPVLVGHDGLLVASFDNFVYLLDARNGDRLWKRRLRGRIVSEPILGGEDRAIVAPLRDDRLTVLGVRDGNRLGAFALDPGEALVAPPLVAGATLLLSTDSGLVAARTVAPAMSKPATAVP
ncbi:MAG: PQQ-binding-like beta-propeller repeat protein [Acidobacteria bacterium]|nr:PQQ-binding-like beta-propeller repeat protein [Acidobacteriota bacterium]